MICPTCGERISAIIPPVRCPACGALPAQLSVRDYYLEAGELAASGDHTAALVVVRRGLEKYNAPELHLLGAILCRRLGQTAEMRRHVAAIPIDDSLRAEAEWLLRSRPEDAGKRSLPTDPALTALLLPPPDAEPARRPRRVRRGWMAVPALAALLVLIWLLPRLLQSLSGVAEIVPEITATSTPFVAVQEPSVATVAPALAPAVEPALLPTATLPADLVRQPTKAEPLAAADEANLGTAAQFDLSAYLAELGRPAAADVAASMVGSQLNLVGRTESFAQRQELIALMEALPQVERVNATDLYIRPPAAYTVRSGDTLWSITYEIYGDVARMEDVYNANRASMASPESLTVGMVLNLPPYE